MDVLYMHVNINHAVLSALSKVFLVVMYNMCIVQVCLIPLHGPLDQIW